VRTLDYQARVLDTLDTYLDRLKAEKQRVEKIANMLKAMGEDVKATIATDFPESVWNNMRKEGLLPASRATIPFSPRQDGIGRDVPNVTLKVPTGGGKTWLAVNAVSRIMGRYLSTNCGFVLWIVPNEAIYSQTLKALKDRQHPYRQALDRSAAGKVLVLEKTDRLDARDVESNLCVMVLMLQSSNRETQSTLKMFQDRGDVAGFTPSEGAQDEHAALKKAIPNLACYDLAESVVGWPLIKDSLGNALRIIRPVVVMDEGQKATSDLAFRTLYDFNPCFVLELSATPKDVKQSGNLLPRYANVLADVSGLELDQEGMIKMPLNLDTRQGTDWKSTLAVALDKLKQLQSEADALRANTRRYIRPIMLVQVERTGGDQRGSGLIHAEDVKAWLLTLGYGEAQIAIKTAEKNDLKQPENQNLLSETNEVSIIITKSALQEGWDCPFAYVLCALAANSNLSAMTQLVGRILRQPHALKTGVDALDECHVITHQATTADVVAKIKEGLEKDGLGDLVITASGNASADNSKTNRNIPRRANMPKTTIWLPKVLVDDGGELREFDYETDLISRLDWSGVDAQAIAAIIPENAQAATTQLQRISLTNTADPIANELVSQKRVTTAFDPAHAVRTLSDIVSNPFVARAIVGDVIDALKSRGFDDVRIGSIGGVILDTLRNRLMAVQMELAETVFKADVEKGRIQFRLRTDGRNWKMPETVETNQPIDAAPLLGHDHTGVKKYLFDQAYRDDFNEEERKVAIHLDKEEALVWWHRNVARAQYGLPGWRRGRLYPDFIFASTRSTGGNRVAVLETKGDQLAGNHDTAYKQGLLALLSKNFQWEHHVEAGQMELVSDSGETIECRLVLFSDMTTKLPELIG
jgi:type III restriction enzyme